MNVTRLRIVYELSRRGSVTAVAEALWMTPSAVSQHLSAFERETGTKLVERAGRGVRLTAAGRTLAEQGAHVIAAIDAAQAAHRLAADETVEWAALKQEAFIVEPRASLFGQTVASACRRAGFEPRVLARVHDLGAMLALAEAAGYVCVLPALAVDDQPLTFRPLLPTVRRRLLAAARPGHHDLPAVKALLAAL